MLRITTLAVTLFAVVLASSGGPIDLTDVKEPPRGRLEVSLTDAATRTQEVWVTFSALEVHHTGSGWISFDPGVTTIDLLKLQGGQAALLEAATLPAGQYNQIRLTVESGYLIDLDGTRCELGISSGQVIFGTHFDIDEGRTTRVLLDFDAEQSIFIHSTGSERECVLRPVIRPVYVTTTGT